MIHKLCFLPKNWQIEKDPEEKQKQLLAVEFNDWKADLKTNYSCVSFPAVWVGLLNNIQTLSDITIFSH